MTETSGTGAARRREPGEELAERARTAFPLLETVRYFDTATKAPMATPVREAMESFLRVRQEEYRDKAEWGPVVARAKARFARLIGAEPDEIGAIKNTSEGLNAIAHSVPWREGDNVVLSATEHPNNLYPWLHLGRRYGVEVRLAPAHGGLIDVGRIAACVDERTRVVAVSAVTFMPGGRTDLASLSHFCRERGTRLVVDAIQAIGPLRVDVARDGIDALAAGGHKGLLGPYGVGFLYCRRDLSPDWEPVYIARASVQANDRPYSFVSDPDYDLLASAARFEIGNYNYEGMHGLDAALGFLSDFDPSDVEAHVLDLSRRLGAGLLELDVPLLSPVDEDSRSGIVAIRVRDADATRHALLARRIAVAVKGNGIRISLHLFNTRDEVDSLLEDLREVLHD